MTSSFQSLISYVTGLVFCISTISNTSSVQLSVYPFSKVVFFLAIRKRSPNVKFACFTDTTFPYKEFQTRGSVFLAFAGVSRIDL